MRKSDSDRSFLLHKLYNHHYFQWKCNRELVSSFHCIFIVCFDTIILLETICWFTGTFEIWIRPCCMKIMDKIINIFKRYIQWDNRESETVLICAVIKDAALLTTPMMHLKWNLLFLKPRALYHIRWADKDVRWEHKPNGSKVHSCDGTSMIMDN